MDNYNYPLGSDNTSAPWNDKDNPYKEIEVTVSITLSKTLKIKVKDYDIEDSGKDEDGNYFESIDYSKCDLEEAVKNQVVLPQYAYKRCLKETTLYNDLKDWYVDDFEVIKE